MAVYIDKKVLIQVITGVSISEILGNQANLSRARNCDLSEHDFGKSLSSFDST